MADGASVVDGDEVRRVMRGTINLTVSTLTNLGLLLVIALSTWGLDWVIGRLWHGGEAPLLLRIVLWCASLSSSLVLVFATILDAVTTLKRLWSETDK